MGDKWLAEFGNWIVGLPGSDGECRAYCINCEDPRTSKSPSASFNFKVEVWHCMSCGKGGSFRTLARLLKKRGDSDTTPPANPQQAAAPVAMPTNKQLKLWVQSLQASRRQLNFLHEERGLNDATIKKFQIGWDRQRFTIPIRDEEGALVNIRRYKPNAPSSKKMVSYKAGSGAARLWGFETIAAHDELFLAEGELDRLVALQHGIPAFTHTGGASTFKMEWAKHFDGKVVYVCYDDDPQGDKGASKVARALKETANAVYRLRLGTDIKGGDLTDFLVKLGRSKDDLLSLRAEAVPLFVRELPHEVPAEGTPITVEESKNPDHKGAVELTAMVSGILDPPYYAPQQILASCDQGAGAKCSGCPLAIRDGKAELKIDRDDERLLKFMDAGDSRKHDLMVSLFDARCKSRISFEAQESWPIEVLAVTPSVAHRTDKVEPPVQRIVYNVGTYKTPVNKLARVVGKTLPDPRSQRALFMGWDLTPVETDLDTFKLTPSVLKRLQRFKVDDKQDPLDKCLEIARDLSANVSLIYGRPMLHVGYDLVWHSITGFNFEGKPITKGWLECLVIGDTRTGKSETAQALIKHYNSGVLHSLESTTHAGLIGGATQAAANQWMVTWGLIPLNDRRLMVLDEMSGMYTNNRGESKGIIEAMSSVRSEGKAQVNKIASGETSARTRLIWVSNPLRATSLSESHSGCLPALSDLVRNPEDIARYDFVMAVASNDVPSSVINSTTHRRVKHRYTAQACQDLVMWAWSRRADQVRFLSGVEEFIYRAAEDLGARYTPDPPLIQIANVRVKVARLAVAIAARTFSTDRSGEVVVVKRAHVNAAVRFLDEIYGQRAMGYARHSAQELENRRKAAKAKGDARKWIKNNPEIIGVLEAVGGGEFRQRDFTEFGGLDQQEAGDVIRKLLGWRMIIRKNKGYMYMSPALVEIMRELEDEEA